MRDFCSASYMGRIAAPGMPKAYSTPSLSRTLTTASMAGIRIAYSLPTRPAARAHLYFAPSTATGFSVVYG